MSARLGVEVLPWWRFLLCVCALYWGMAVQPMAMAQATPSVSAATLRLEAPTLGRPLDHIAQHWVDSTGAAGLDAARAAWAQGQFQPAQGDARTPPPDQAQWIRLAVERTQAPGDWLLALHTTAIDDVRFFGPFDAQGRALAPPVETGLVQPYANRPLGLERPVMRLDLPEPGLYEVYVRLQSRSSQNVAVSVWDSVSYVQSRQPKRLFDGITYGILLTLLVYNAVLSMVFRREGYELYVLTCAAALFTLASFNGHVAHYLLGSWPWWQQRANPLGAGLWILFSALFGLRFLELRTRHCGLGRVLMGVAGLAGLAVLLALLGQTAQAQWTVEWLAVGGSVAAAVAAAQVWRQGFAPAAWYLTGQALLFAAALGMVAVNRGLIDAPFLLANGLQMGVVAEMLVFAYAMAARVRALRQRQTELRREADHLAEAVATDALTGLANRVGLSQRAQQLATEQQAHAVMLLDLDRFKPVNDTHGHEVGDRLLIEVARRLQSQMRQGDLVARLGGDEFVVLLGGRQSPTQLAAMAQRLCEAVQQPLLHAGHLISVDASIGIARCPEHGQTLTELLRHADAAMYRAKQAHSGFAFYEPASASA